jgi:hypothetical protein
VYIRTYKFKTP